MTLREKNVSLCQSVLRPAVVVCLLGLLSLAGCHQQYYSPHNLPEQLAALPPRDVESLDLSKFVHAAARSDSIYAGDVLDVTIATGAEQETPPTWTLRTAEDGTVAVPLLGQVPVAGRKLTDAEDLIRQVSMQRQMFRNPTVAIEVKNRRSNLVRVRGAVKEPGEFELPPHSSDLGSALIAAGGLAEDADTIVEIRYPSSEVYQRGAPWEKEPEIAGPARNELAAYDANGRTAPSVRSVRVDLLQDAVRGGQRYYLEDGAVVMVRKQEPTTIQVIGLVKRADQFEVPAGQDVRMLDAIAMAQGRTLQLADKVRVIRNVPGHSEPVVIELSMRDAKSNRNSNIRLMAGDVVSVEETPVTFIVEMARSMIRFGFSSAVPGF